MSFLSENFIRKKESSSRVKFIDLAKGICILLVVYEHTAGSYIGENTLVHLRMPLYFVLSGLFFKTYDGISDFLRRKINKLLIPFLTFYIIGYIFTNVSALALSNPVLKRDLLEVFYSNDYFNNPIWFLICLFWANIYFWIISNLFSKEWLRAAVVLFGGLIGWTIGETYSLYLVQSLSVLPFFYFGSLLGHTSLLIGNGSIRDLMWGGGNTLYISNMHRIFGLNGRILCFQFI